MAASEEAAAQMQPVTYFHCAPMRLAAGSIIEPGNWGRMLRLYEVTNGQIQGNVLNEALLEFARQLHAPTAPKAAMHLCTAHFAGSDHLPE
jgi:hypothetical protein